MPLSLALASKPRLVKRKNHQNRRIRKNPRIYDACQCPVGRENLAFAYSLEEVKRHGAFLEKLVASINGFVILDLHNLYCQSHNFSLPFTELLKLYPLHLVREIHISGGSWQAAHSDSLKTIRRDTHDYAVPEEVFDLLKISLPKCNEVKYVVMEQLGTALQTPDSSANYRDDFSRMRQIVHQSDIKKRQQSFIPSTPVSLNEIIEDERLDRQQRVLSDILEHSITLEDALSRLHQSPLAHSSRKIETWDKDMLETAMMIAQKWKG